MLPPVHMNTATAKDEITVAASLKIQGKLNVPSVALFLNALRCALVTAGKNLSRVLHRMLALGGTWGIVYCNVVSQPGNQGG